MTNKSNRRRQRPQPFPEPVFVTRPLFPPLRAYTDLLEGVWERRRLTNKGPLVEELERALRRHLRVQHLSLVANGTLGLVLALKAMQVSGEVITTPFTFPATVHAILWAGLQPVFVDIDPISLTIDPEKVEGAVTQRTSAILGVHIYGIACHVRPLRSIADRRGLCLVYDGAHTFGTIIDGQPLLRFGDATVLSFHATKLYNTAEGGAVVTRSSEIKQRVDLLRNLGIRDETSVPLSGLNARMNELAAALGLANLRVIEAESEGRAKIAAVYRKRLHGLRGLHCVGFPTGNSEGRHYFVVRIDSESAPVSRDELCDKLKSFNVFARRYFFPLCSEMPAYAGLPSSSVENLPVATKVSREVLALPFYAALGTEGAHRICDVIDHILSADDG